MPGRIPVTFNLELTLLLTRAQARQARSDTFRARLRSALEHSTAREALTDALDLEIDRFALRGVQARRRRQGPLHRPKGPRQRRRPADPGIEPGYAHAGADWTARTAQR